MLTDKENVGLQSAIDVSESFDESSLCASNLTSLSLSGRESTGSASDMTVVAENATSESVIVCSSCVCIHPVTTRMPSSQFGHMVAHMTNVVNSQLS